MNFLEALYPQLNFKSCGTLLIGNDGVLDMVPFKWKHMFY